MFVVREGEPESRELLVVTDIGFALWKSAPDKDALLASFKSQLHPLSWMGSLASALERRLHLFDELKADDHASELALAKAKAEVQKWVNDQRAREQEEERQRSSSFE